METKFNFEDAVEHLKKKLTPSALGQIRNVFTFEFKDENETYTLDGTDENGKGWLKGPANEYDLISNFHVTISKEDFANLVFGKLNPMAGMVSGRMKIKGSIKEALKLDRILKS